jgi:GNAT superfamily N-acetyltransferase
MTSLVSISSADRPDLREAAGKLHSGAWPVFQSNGAAVRRFWSRLYTDFPEYQFAVLADESTPIGVGNTIPLQWDGSLATLPTGWDDAVERAFTPDVKPANTLCALAAIVERNHRGAGVSRYLIEEMKRLAVRHGLRCLIAPIRPTWKSRYPLTLIERYVGWRRPDGSAFDPWLRTHLRIGGVILGVAPRSTVIEGTVSEWEEWTGMSFPESGSYVIPDALVPLQIDIVADHGLYVEPNIWVLHRLNSSSSGTSEPKPDSLDIVESAPNH